MQDLEVIRQEVKQKIDNGANREQIEKFLSKKYNLSIADIRVSQPQNAQPKPSLGGSGMVQDNYSMDDFKRDYSQFLYPTELTDAERQVRLEKKRGIQNMLVRGATFGLSDELYGAGSALLGHTGEGEWFNYEPSLRDTYEKQKTSLLRDDEEFRKKHPTAALVAELVGGMGTGVGAYKAGATLLKTGLPTIPALAGDAAIYGGLQAYGDDQDVMKGASTGAMFGAGLGVAGKAIGKGVQGVIDYRKARQFTKLAPSAEKIADDAAELYNRLRASGVTVAPKGQKMLRSQVNKINKDFVINPKSHTTAYGYLQDFRNLGKTAARMDLDVGDFRFYHSLRSSLSRDTVNASTQEREVLKRMIDAIDDLLTNPKKGAISSGNSTQAIDDLKNANALWSRLKRAEIVEDIINNAQTQKSGIENGIRLGFTALSKNKKKLAGFSDAEKEIIRRLANRNDLEGALKFFSALAPYGQGKVSSLMGMSGMGAGMAMGGMPLMATSASVGLAAASSGAKLAQGKSELLRKFVLMGMTPQEANLAYTSLEKALTNPETAAMVRHAILAPTSTSDVADEIFGKQGQ